MGRVKYLTSVLSIVHVGQVTTLQQMYLVFQSGCSGFSIDIKIFITYYQSFSILETLMLYSRSLAIKM
jgi:hypothetical protein